MGYRSYKYLGDAKGLKLLGINPRSLKGKMSQLRPMLHNIDYICVSESWLKSSTLKSLIDLPNMTLYRQDRPRHLGKTGGGVACFVSNCYAPYTQVCPELTQSSKHLESLGLITFYPGQKQRTYNGSTFQL